MKKMLLPIIKKYYKLLLSTMLVMALGCGIMTGLSGAYVSLKDALNEYVEDYKYPDAVITTEISNRSTLDEVSKVDGVETLNARLCADTVMKNPEGRYLSVRVFSYNDDDLQLFKKWSTADPKGKESVYLEHNFAEDNGIKAGDTVSFKVDDDFRDYFVEAIVSRPETLSVQPTNESWGENADFGFAYASVELLKAESKKESSDAQGELDKKSADLKKAKKDAEQELDNAKEKLAEAKEQLADKESSYKNSESEAQTKKDELNNTKTELQNSKAELESNLATLQSTSKSLSDTEASLNEQRASLVQAQKGLDEIDSAISSLKSQKSGDLASAVDSVRGMPSGTSISGLTSAANSVSSFAGTAAAYGVSVDTSSASAFESDLNSIQSDYATLSSAGDLVARVEAGEEGVTESAEFIEVINVIWRYDGSASESNFSSAYYSALSTTGALSSMISGDLYSSAEELEALGGSMSAGMAQAAALSSLASQVSAATGQPVSTVGELVSAYDSSVASVDSEIAKLEAQRASVVSSLNAQGVSESDIPAAISSIDSSISEIEDNLAEIEDSIPTINSGLQEIEDGIKEIDDGITEINSQLTTAQQQLSEAEAEITENEKEINKSWADSLTEFSSLDKELNKAYAELKDNEGYEALFNQILLYFKDGADPKATLKAAEKALGDIVVKSSFTYEDSAVKNRIDINLQPIETLSIFMPMVFFIIILIIVFLFMSLIIKQCRREIGILRALGFTKGSIKGLFCGVNAFIAVFAVILGFGVGYGIILYVGKYFKDYFPLPEMDYFYDWKMAVLAAVLTVAVGIAATLISATAVSKIQPSEAMSRPAPSTYNMPRFLQALTKSTSPMTKFSITSLLRNKLRFVFSVICIAGSVMMIFSSLAFISSKNFILHQYYDQRVNYDCQIFYTEQPTDEELNSLSALKFVDSVQPLKYYEAKVTFDGKSDDTVINALTDGSELIRVYDKDENQLSVPEDGIVLEKHTAEKLGAKAGDVVKVNGASLMVTAISDQCIGRVQYVSEKTASRLGDPSLGCVILDISRKNEQSLLEYITKDDNYLYCVFTRLSYEGNQRVFKTYDLAAWIIISFAIIIGLAIVLNTSRTNLLEKKKELCILATLGFTRGEISRSWFSQSLIQFICACAVGLPTGIVIAKTALNMIQTAGREYPFANSVKEYIFTVVLVFLYILISHILSMRSMKKWDMVETVKEKE